MCFLFSNAQAELRSFAFSWAKEETGGAVQEQQWKSATALISG